MAEQVKSPEPGQYWEHVKSKDRAYFIGRAPDGEMVWQCEGDIIEVGNLDWSDWQHIPGCTGWDWEPEKEEEFPQYWTTICGPSSSIAYIKRIDEKTIVSVKKDGTEVPDNVLEWDLKLRKRLTKEEAAALLTPEAETFPQWYILKEDERRSWVPDWIIKRTGEETSIRYARDEAGEIYATEEPWYGPAGCWERCNAAEAFGRLGTAMLPEVTPAKKRFPIDLWVTYRVHDERGDWPVRATPAGEPCENWKRIQFDSNGAFVEVE